jgi:cellulose synthase/poly-beta-1,6-N-acetylglucosamine synthase-like glycosyltransferase
MDAIKGRSTPINKSASLMTATIGGERDIRERVEYYSKYAIGGFAVLTGGNFFIRRSVIDQLGWFDEDLLTEDMDFAARLQIEGYRLGHDPRMTAFEEAPGGLRGFHRTDTIFLLTFTIFAPVLILYYSLITLREFGKFGGAMVPYEITLIASSITLFTPLAIFLVAHHDRKEGRAFDRTGLYAVFLIPPYLLVYSVAAWHAFLDEFILRRPNIYRKYPRSGLREGEKKRDRGRRKAPDHG